METDFGFFRRGRGMEEGLDFAPDGEQGFVVAEELGVDFCEALEDFGLAHEQFALAAERADDIDAHLHGFRASQEVCGHECAVFGEGEWRK
jgi:hypothetical protein